VKAVWAKYNIETGQALVNPSNFKEFSKKVRKLSARTKTQLGGENLKKILRIKRILKICSDPAGDFGGKVNEEYVRESIKQEIVNEINKLYTT